MLDEKYLDDQIILDLETEDENLNNKAFKYLYKHVYPLVYSFIRQRSGTKREADDTFQEAMIVLYENIKKKKFRGEARVSTYLYATVRNIWFSKLKKSKRMVHVEDMTMIENEDAKSNANEKFALIMQVLDEMGESCKTILKKYYFDHCSMNEIKIKMGFSSEESAKTQKYKCMQKLIAKINSNPALKKALKEYI
ncbi:MAG: sigma-70 family RNA polymerase sigma factor [Bacteroidetes bacterium]|nr:sigma-70 family RNA polymerase sigma factor [Bacteroidota bacterium]MBL6964732.1 sigma-70 family RNA polymerase sigma factor [Bacteroidota bacterium]